ncbi:MAG: glutamate--tRNA ligase, partial [Parasphingopyxis sp.]
GTSDPVEPFTEVTPLIESFDFARFGRAPARFDSEELQTLNAKILHQLDYDAVAGRLPQGMGADGWQAIRPNLNILAEAHDWWHVVEGPLDSVAFDAETCAFLDQAAEIAATLDWSNAAWKSLTSALKEQSGRKGKALFLPLRQALTGRDQGPEMAALLPLIGKERAIARLARCP